MNTVGPGYSWRVVYNALEKNVIAIVESAAKTASIYDIAEFQTKDEAMAFIVAEGLRMPPDQGGDPTADPEV